MHQFSVCVGKMYCDLYMSNFFKKRNFGVRRGLRWSYWAAPTGRAQHRSSTDPIGTSQLQAASGTQSYGGYGNGPSKGPWDQSYTTPGGRKRVVFPWEMGGPVTLGSSKTGNKNIMMWGKLLANEGRSTWIHHVEFKHLKWPCFFSVLKKTKTRPKRPFILSIGFQGFSRSEMVRRSVSNQVPVDWWIWPALFRFSWGLEAISMGTLGLLLRVSTNDCTMDWRPTGIASTTLRFRAGKVDFDPRAFRERQLLKDSSLRLAWGNSQTQGKSLGFDMFWSLKMGCFPWVFFCKSLQPMGFHPLSCVKSARQRSHSRPEQSGYSYQAAGRASNHKASLLMNLDFQALKHIKTSKWLRNVTQICLSFLQDLPGSFKKFQPGRSLNPAVLFSSCESALMTLRIRNRQKILPLYHCILYQILPDLTIHNCHIISRRMRTYFIWALSSSCKIVSLCTTPMYLWATGDVGKT